MPSAPKSAAADFAGDAAFDEPHQLERRDCRETDRRGHSRFERDRIDVGEREAHCLPDFLFRVRQIRPAALASRWPEAEERERISRSCDESCSIAEELIRAGALLGVDGPRYGRDESAKLERV